MQIGKLETENLVGNIFYFIVNRLHPAHAYDNEVYNYYYYYVVTLDSSYKNAFYFLCSSLCDVNDKNALIEWHELYQRLFEEQSLPEFITCVKSTKSKVHNKEWLETAEKSMNWPILCYSKSSALGILNKLSENYQRVEHHFEQPNKKNNNLKLAEKDIYASQANKQNDIHRNTSSSSSSNNKLIQLQERQHYENIYNTSLVNLNVKKMENNQEIKKDAFQITSADKNSINNVVNNNVLENQQNSLETLAHVKTSNKASVIQNVDAETCHNDNLAVTNVHEGNNDKLEETNSVKVMEKQITMLTENVNMLSARYAKNLNTLVETNDKTITQLHEQFAAREDELNKIYRVALQNRDLRIAHLTEDLWQLHREYNYLQETRKSELRSEYREINESRLYGEKSHTPFNNYEYNHRKLLNELEVNREELQMTKHKLSVCNTELVAARNTINNLRGALLHIKGEIPFLHKYINMSSITDKS